jgi:hypothetical protein
MTLFQTGLFCHPFVLFMPQYNWNIANVGVKHQSIKTILLLWCSLINNGIHRWERELIKRLWITAGAGE